jgi:hypothetical protein
VPRFQSSIRLGRPDGKGRWMQDDESEEAGAGSEPAVEHDDRYSVPV